MIRFKEIRSAIVRGLKEHTRLMVIEMNGGGDVPKTAFLTYDFVDGFGSGRGFPAISQLGDIQQQTETVNFTVSFLSYADDKAASFDNAMKARDWFRGAGRLMLKESVDVIPVDIGSVENRDVNIGTEWERRQGFDIEFRTVDVSESELGTIEKAIIKGVERIGTT
ncbi:hypothetical protein D3C87_1246150 [compost metagenome]